MLWLSPRFAVLRFVGCDYLPERFSADWRAIEGLVEIEQTEL